MKHGKGLSIDGEGNTYEGDYKYDKRDGYGTYTFKSGNRYIGGFFNGKKHGKGIFNYINGDTYEGEFNNGNMNFNRNGSMSNPHNVEKTVQKFQQLAKVLTIPFFAHQIIAT